MGSRWNDASIRMLTDIESIVMSVKSLLWKYQIPEEIAEPFMRDLESIKKQHEESRERRDYLTLWDRKKILEKFANKDSLSEIEQKAINGIINLAKEMLIKEAEANKEKK